jgi:hypothetical protein
MDHAPEAIASSGKMMSYGGRSHSGIDPASATSRLPALVAAAGERAQTRFWEFFVSNIRNPHTRRA